MTTPTAKELVAINAIAASPLILLRSLARSNKKAAAITTGIAQPTHQTPHETNHLQS